MVPKISICIPTYSRSDLLEKTLISVTRQTVRPYEVIVVDNCSPDDTASVAARFADQGVRYHCNEQNLGMAGNWNRCIQLASGDFLTILHSDDLISPSWYEQWSRIISRYQDDQNVGAFFSHVFTIDMDENTLMIFRLFAKECLLVPGENFRRLWAKHMCALPASGGIIFRKAIFNKIGEYHLEYGTETDIDLVLRLLNNFAVYFTPLYLYAYRIHPFQTFDKEKQTKSYDKKFSVLERNLSIFMSFYRTQLKPDYKTPDFYKRVAQMYIAIGLFHMLTGKWRIGRTYLKLTRTYIPDLYSVPGDYALLIEVLVHYVKVIVFGRLRAFCYFRNYALTWAAKERVAAG